MITHDVKRGSSSREKRTNNFSYGVGTSSIERIQDLLQEINSILIYKNNLLLDLYYKFNTEYQLQEKDLEGHKYIFGTSLNTLDSSKELKSKVVGYNSLQLTIINIVKDIDALLSYVADETLKTGSISE